jgi:hypothetical protein
MKTSIKIFACATVALIGLLACDDTSINNANDTEQNGSVLPSSGTQSSSSFENSSNKGIPIMDSRVVSYKKNAIGYNESLHYETLAGKGFVTNEDILKSAFPHVFDKEYAKCNYFAIYFVSGSSSPYYWILSQDMNLYRITPGNGSLVGTTDIVFDAMLVCDDTAEGNLKDRIKLDSTYSYIDPDWDYDKESTYGRGVFF